MLVSNERHKPLAFLATTSVDDHEHPGRQVHRGPWVYLSDHGGCLLSCSAWRYSSVMRISTSISSNTYVTSRESAYTDMYHFICIPGQSIQTNEITHTSQWRSGHPGRQYYLAWRATRRWSDQTGSTNCKARLDIHRSWWPPCQHCRRKGN